MSIRHDNNTFELKITPNKRKRDSAKSHHDKENNFVFNNFMEVKSIADLVKQKKTPSMSATSTEQSNPFELVRKPPKKRSKHDIDDNCFVNPALNINGPEKAFNPFEVKRMPNIEQDNHCFTNPGLNIRGAERDVVNPFEVVRDVLPPQTIADVQGIENPALDMQPTLAIAVPFTPTVGCRIDFNNIPLDALTPCSMLNNKLVFSPIRKPSDLTPKRPNLSIISEEAVDISKELESYQLELENSMNEAKATKKRGNKNMMDMRRKSTFARRLMDAVVIDDAADDGNQSMDSNEQSVAIASDEKPANRPNCEHSCQESSDGHSDCPKSSTPKTPNENCIAKYPLEKSVGENPDFVYEEIDEMSHHCPDGINEAASAAPAAADNNDAIEIVAADAPASVKTEEFRNPAPFVRTYRRDVRRPIVNAVARDEATAPQAATIDEKPKEHHEVFGSIRSSIRKSIRKLIQPSGADGATKTKSSENVSSKDGATTPASSSASSNILASIRHSMRRKQPIKPPLATSTPCESLHDISIIDDCKPRAVFRDTAIAVAEKVAAMDAGGEMNAFDGGMFKGRTTLRSSFRKSSRHVIRSVFKRNIEDYDLRK